MDRAKVKSRLRAYIRQHAGEEVGDAVALFEDKIVNSLFAITLMSFIEKEFHVKFTMDDIDWDRLRSIDAVTELILEKRKVA